MVLSARTIALTALITLLGWIPARGQNVSQCAEEYAQAETAYYDAAFDRAVRLLRTCLDEANLTPDTRVRFYRLLAFAHIARGDRGAARNAAARLLDLDPTYAPDPSVDRPDFVELVRDVKATRRAAEPQDETHGPRWLRWAMGGAGAIVAGTAALLLTGGEGEDASQLPAPPPLPE